MLPLALFVPPLLALLGVLFLVDRNLLVLPAPGPGLAENPHRIVTDDMRGIRDLAVTVVHVADLNDVAGPVSRLPVDHVVRQVIGRLAGHPRAS